MGRHDCLPSPRASEGRVRERSPLVQCAFVASIGHVAMGLTAARIHDLHPPRRWPPLRALLLWSLLSMLPDVDVVGFRLGIPYAAPFGHRGATHSFLAAALLALTALLVSGAPRRRAAATAFLVFAVVASHDLLDTMTDGGLGCALLWPLSHHRFFAPWRPIPVAPIGLDFLSPEGARVAFWELAIFFPFFLCGLWPARRPSATSE